MKRMIKLNLTILIMLITFLAWPGKVHALKVESAIEIINSDIIIDEVILKVDVYLREYSKEFPADDLTTGKIDLNEYLVEKLEADQFTAEEISRAFEIIAENRQEKLINLVEMYLDEEPLLSKNALILKLKENSYSQEEIEQGLTSVDMDWKEQAVKASEKYINTEIEVDEESYLIISRKSLHQLLVKEKEFTLEEASYGLEESAIDWDKQAFKQAKYYLAADVYSKKDLINKLISDEFTKKEAEYGVTETQTNWKEQAVKKSDTYLNQSLLPSKEGLQNYLKREGFSQEEADYAANLIFKDADEEELEVEEPSVEVPTISVPERPIIIKPIEFITSYIVISPQVATNRPSDSKDLSIKDPSSTTTKKTRSTKIEKPRVAEAEVVEDEEELEQTSLFDSPVFAPVIIVLVVGNLYLFQKT